MKRRTWTKSVPALPAVGIAMLPKVICPMCSPAYAAVVSALGLGFLISTPYLLPLTLVLLSLAVGSLPFRAASRRGLAPFWTGLAAAIGVLTGKFWVDSTTMTYAAVGLLVVASAWNVVPPRKSADSCPACLPTEAGSLSGES